MSGSDYIGLTKGSLEIECVEELNKVCSIYGQGKYADTNKYSINLGEITISTGGRSVNIDDVTDIGYTVIEKTKTYTTGDDGYVLNDDGTSSDKTFTYWGEYAVPSEGKEWKTLGANSSVVISSPSISGSESSALAKRALIGTDDQDKGPYCFYATKFAAINSGSAILGLFGTHVSGNFSVRDIWYSHASNFSYSIGYVRPVVYLDKNIILDYNSTTGEYTIKE